ncbi:hypothetical protein [Burkholderia ubonensis]|uniref:hypothetical protein n=1 Tax=Burkholderia ubonensis TaxID=101571 RepID=UPI00016A2E4E|nr:hypothetical protein [Burkholderia ubonensis]
MFGFRCLYLAVAAMSFTLSAHAAGIDCSAAKTRTDRMICGECYWAVLSNGRRAAVATTQGIIGTDDATLHSVSTFRFDR